MSKIAHLTGFLLRLLVAVCAAPLIVGWQVTVAFLEAHVSPSTVLFIVLTVLGVGLAVLIGLVFTMHADPDLIAFHYPGLAERLNMIAGYTTAFTVVATLTVASTWAFGSIAEQHTCTVVSVGSVEQMMNQGTRDFPIVRLECADGREDTVGGVPMPLTHHTWRFWDEGDQVRVAYDPDGDLASRAADDLRTPVRNWLVGIGTAVTMLLHVMIVVTVAYRRWRTS